MVLDFSTCFQQNHQSILFATTQGFTPCAYSWDYYPYDSIFIELLDQGSCFFLMFLHRVSLFVCFLSRVSQPIAFVHTMVMKFTQVHNTELLKDTQSLPPRVSQPNRTSAYLSTSHTIMKQIMAPTYDSRLFASWYQLDDWIHNHKWNTIIAANFSTQNWHIQTFSTLSQGSE